MEWSKLFSKSGPFRFNSSLFVLEVLAVLVLSTQFASNAFQGEFGDRPDTAAHLVTGIMVGQYITAVPAPPMDFARDYYLHYPKIGLGNWPPAFYAFEGLWTLLFSPSRTSIVLFLGMITVLFGFTLYRFAAPELGRPLAAFVSALLVLYPAVNLQSSRVLSDNACAMMSLLAALLFLRYLERPTWWHSVLWAGVASAAILTKGNALALAALPGLSIIFSGRYQILRRPSFWIAAPVVAALCGPWYWYTIGVSVGNWSATKPHIGPEPWVEVIASIGYEVVAVAIVGLAVEFIRPALRRSVNTRAAVLAALLFAWLSFHMIVPVGTGVRKQLLAFAVVLYFFGLGLRWISQRLSWGALTPRRSLLVLVCLSLVSFFVFRFQIVPKTTRGFAALAESIAADNQLEGTAILVSSTGYGEDSFIAELAILQPKPLQVVLRGSKFLSKSTWNGDRYELLYKDLPSIAAALESVPVSTLVIDTVDGPYPAAHHQQMLDLVARKPEIWKPVGAFPGHSESGSRVPEILVYRRAGPLAPVSGEISIDVNNSLGGRISSPGVK